jgi:hypothetical protein
MSDYQNQNTTSVQAQKEMCREFIALIKANYPQLRTVKVIYGKYYGELKFTFRARFRYRYLYAWSMTPEYGIARFMLEIQRKLLTETCYSPSEFEKIKHQLQERVIMKYSIKELPN